MTETANLSFAQALGALTSGTAVLMQQPGTNFHYALNDQQELTQYNKNSGNEMGPAAFKGREVRATDWEIQIRPDGTSTFEQFLRNWPFRGRVHATRLLTDHSEVHLVLTKPGGASFTFNVLGDTVSEEPP